MRYLLLILLMPAVAAAAGQRLSDLSCTSQKMDNGVVVINTSGSAKLRLSFITPSMARVEIAPSGVFLSNASPAVDGTPIPLTDTRMSDRDGLLLLQNKGLSLRVDKQHLRVDAYDASNINPVSLEDTIEGTTWDSASGFIRHSRILDSAEHIYGLGEDNANHGTLDRRGTNREMWTGQQIRSGNVTANYPVPFYLSNGISGRGYGCFVDNVWHMNFDIGKTNKDRLTWAAPGGPIDYYLINGPAFKSLIDQYTRLTGRPSMLPLYALGYWQSRCFFNDFVDIQHSVDRLKSGGLPLDVLVIDSAWSNKEIDFTWSDKFLKGKTAEAWIAGLHAGGAKTMLSTKGPMLRSDASCYPDALSKGLFATDGHGKTLTTGYYGGELMDFTHPEMAPWLTKKLSPLTSQGIDSWWLDLIEPEGEPPQAVYFKGKSADIHNTFPLLNYRTYYDYCKSIAPELRPVILGRAASAGTQRYSGIVWTGDINSDWPTFRAHLPEAQNSGLSGLPYWTNDSGGFISGFLNNDRYGAHAELYQRWFEFTCFAPIARAHKAGPSEPYNYGPEVEATAKKYLHLRYQLLPYIYNMVHETASTGIPMLRPLVLEYQNDPASANAKSEYLFGNDLLVAPVIWANVTARQVYFPPGHWISYEDGFEIAGGASLAVSAPRDRIPLFVRRGTILPTAPDMMYTSEKPWDPITLDIWPEGKSTGSVYQDDFNTIACSNGESTTTTFDCEELPGRSITFKIEPSNQKFGPQQWVARFHLTTVPTQVSLDGKSVQRDAEESSSWSFDSRSYVLVVRLRGERSAHALSILLDGSLHARPSPPRVQATVIAEGPAEGAARQIAQFLPPPKLPIRIEAANYDKGGEGLAFHMIKPVEGTIYRQDGVPIIASTDAGGGYAIAALGKEEWLAYTIDAGDGGWFKLSARVRPTVESELTLLKDRKTILTSIHIPAPANAPAWTSANGEQSFLLPPGEQVLTVRVSKPGFELANFTFAKGK